MKTTMCMTSRAQFRRAPLVEVGGATRCSRHSDHSCPDQRPQCPDAYGPGGGRCCPCNY